MRDEERYWNGAKVYEGRLGFGVSVPEDRIRKKFTEREMRELEESIKTFGQLQPGVCIRNEETDGFLLVAGERRLRACTNQGVPFQFILREDLKIGDRLLKQIELEENIQRQDLDFKEEADAIDKLHTFMQEEKGESVEGVAGGHTIEDTAKLLGKSRGIVSEDLDLSFWAKHFPEEVGKARNKTEAKKAIKRIKEGMKRTKALDDALDRNGDREKKGKVKVSGPKEKLERRLMEYDKRCLEGKMEALLPNLEGPFSLVFFDPPWGVDFDKVMLKHEGVKSYGDESEGYEEVFSSWIQMLWEKMEGDSHLYLFFSIQKYTMVYETLEKVGFQTNRIPLIWYKRGARRTRNPDIWPGRSYEPIAYARKGSKVLALKGASDVIRTPAPTPRIKADHPSAKHPQVYRELIERSAMPGDKVLDPMSGSGMVGVACESLRSTLELDWTMIEMDKGWRDLGLYNLHKGYEQIIGDVEGIEEPAPIPPTEEKAIKGDFRELVPSTREWTAHWKRWPEDQEEMLKWKKINS